MFKLVLDLSFRQIFLLGQKPGQCENVKNGQFFSLS